MKLQRIKCTPLDRARSITVSPSYVVGCTGRKAVVLDRQYNVVRIVDGLSYVYRAHLSPDETQLLLISNENRFYVTDMASGETRKVTIRAPFNYNLEGEGCWSHDGSGIYIPVMHSKTLTNTLRRYRAEDLKVDREYLPEGFLISRLQRLEKPGLFFMTFYDRETMRHSFVHLRDDEFSVYPMEKGTTLLPGCSINEDQGEAGIPGHGFYGRYTLEGKLIERIGNPSAEKEAMIENPLAALEEMCGALAEKYSPDGVPEVNPSGENAMRLSSVDMQYENMITKYALSACGKYAFMSTNAGFYLLDAASRELLAHIPEQFGVQDFEQLEDDVIALATWSGAKLFRMTGE